MSIKKHHRPSCTGGTCDCPWRLSYRPLGMAGPHKRINFPTRKEAERHRSETQVKVSRNEYISPAAIPLFSKVAQEWLAEKHDRHPATKCEAANVLRHLEPLNSRRLDTINVPAIEKLRDDLQVKRVGQRSLAPRSVARIMGSLAAIFKVAMRKGYTTSNPAAVALRPRKAVTEVDEANEAETGALRPDEVLSSAEIARLIEHAEPGLWRCYIATAAATGLRSEELNALQWGDVEIDAGKLYVKRSLAWFSATAGETLKPGFFQPKTRAGTRTLPLAPELVSLLRTWKLKCPPSKNDLVFTETGLPLRRSRVLAGGLHPACRRAGLRRANVKTLRHSYASALLARGCPLTQVSHLMGHSSPMITLKTYSHWLPDTDNGEAHAYAASFLSGTAASVAPERTGMKRELVGGNEQRGRC